MPIAPATPSEDARSSAPAHANVVICEDCDTAHRRVRVNGVARCTQCNAILYRDDELPTAAALVVAVTAVVGFMLALGAPMVTVTAKGQQLSVSLVDAALGTADHGLAIAAIVIAATLLIIPLLELCLLLYVLVPYAAGYRPHGFESALRAVRHLRPWRMIEVLLLGVGIAIVKLNSMAVVTPGWGVFGIALMTASLAAFTTFDLERRLLEPVPHDPSTPPRDTRRAWAFLIAAAALYVPANLLPIVYTTKFPLERRDTIVSGIQLLWDTHACGLAAIVFTASVVVPLAKIIALALVMRRSSRYRRARTTTMRVLERIGQWSMLDVFVVALLTSLVHLGRFANAEAGPAIVPFAGVVVLTMLAAFAFDPRTIWRSP